MKLLSKIQVIMVQHCFKTRNLMIQFSIRAQSGVKEDVSVSHSFAVLPFTFAASLVYARLQFPEIGKPDNWNTHTQEIPQSHSTRTIRKLRFASANIGAGNNSPTNSIAVMAQMDPYPYHDDKS